ncbi:Flp family type IVb pilin [Vibrio europaeus]|uniref:Flp family type IVb pilin n=1 Tax=Vibrio europaeus TaxID=300876 RepID=UPI00233E572A|nr:Flp family type IVb pilin [Vibrio europaeus]MDC5856843.1 Flp family type IVb pilin [Vibrio europaeus]
MKKLLNDFIKNEDGVTAIEYAVIGVAMAAVLFTAFGSKAPGSLRGNIEKAFQDIATVLSGNKPT